MADPITDTIVINYDKLREARGIRSAKSVAEAVGISRQLLWLIETGKQSPRGDVLTKLCWLYGLDISKVTTNGFNNGKHKAAA